MSNNLRRVITTVGTSFLSNYKRMVKDTGDSKNSVNPEYLDGVEGEAYCNYKEDGEKYEELREGLEKDFIKNYKRNEENKWEKEEGHKNVECCAEIKSLKSFYDDEKKKNSDLKLVVNLVATKTVASHLCADIIKEALPTFIDNVEVEAIELVEGMDPNDSKKFSEKGVNSLFKVLEKITNKREEKYGKGVRGNTRIGSENTFVNISGGYKVLIPYLTIFTQLCGIKSIYSYENTNTVITIPSLPVQVDWAFAEAYYPFLGSPNAFGNSKPLKTLKDKKLVRGDGKSRTPLGEFFNNVVEKELHVSKTVMGYFFEYKLYEYYIDNPYKERYKYVRHGIEVMKNGSSIGKISSMGDIICELDLLLSSKKGKLEEITDYIVVEVKSIRQLDKKHGRLKKLIKQVEKQKKALGSKNATLSTLPTEYHLCIYTPNKREFNSSSNRLKKALESIKEVVESDNQISFKAFIMLANYQIENSKRRDLARGYSNENPYQQLMKDKLSKDSKGNKDINIKEIIL